ncbi:MAG: cell division protein ZapA [Thermodesulfobacteriota bacterium]
MRTVKINFLNNEYSIKTDAEYEYVQDIALFLENKVKEVSKQASSMVVPRPLFLATLKIIDDYFRIKTEFEDFKNSADQRSKELVEILERSLREESPFDSPKGL